MFFISVGKEIWLLWQLKVSIDLKREKWKLAIFSGPIADISIEFYFCRNVYRVVLYSLVDFYPNPLFRLVGGGS